jgi:hypothetical protein
MRDVWQKLVRPSARALFVAYLWLMRGTAYAWRIARDLTLDFDRFVLALTSVCGLCDVDMERKKNE